METKALAESVTDHVLAYRRDFHKFPEPGWLEFRTSAKIAAALMELGYAVKLGHDVGALYPSIYYRTFILLGGLKI